MKKILGKIFSGLLIAFVVLLVGFDVIALTSKKKNYNVPKVFGYSFLSVLTDSMEPTLKVGTGIVIISVSDYESLKVQEVNEEGEIIEKGDILTFYSYRLKAPVSHRLISKNYDETKGVWNFETFGDNMESIQCPVNKESGKHDCSDLPHDYFTDKELIGKVVRISPTVGFMYRAINQQWTILVFVMIPAGYLVVVSFLDFRKAKKELELEEQEEAKQKYLEELKKQEVEKMKQEMRERKENPDEEA